ncbi:MAG: hypothetical protein AAFP16_03335 [Pseudomonadota bacterium]
MRAILFLALLTCALAQSAQAQTTPPDGVWVTVNDVDSADLVVRGWTMIGTTALPAGQETGLLVTFWRDTNGNVMRCIFSLISPTGGDAFETCSVAATVTDEDSQ